MVDYLPTELWHMPSLMLADLQRQTKRSEAIRILLICAIVLLQSFWKVQRFFNYLLLGTLASGFLTLNHSALAAIEIHIEETNLGITLLRVD
jgi:hypothetical protein